MADTVLTSQPQVAAVSGPATPSKKPERLLSLDIFRGLTIGFMILVNNSGSDAAYWPLKHAEWNGWTPTDLVFPFFVFIVGVSMVFAFAARQARGATKGQIFRHVLQRSAIIFALGLFIYGFPYFHLSTWRIPGVLQRIAVCYLIASILTLWAGRRARIVWTAVFLVSYYILMRFVPVPGYGVPTHDVPLLDPDRNLAAWLDRKLMWGHLYERVRDPEGLLSTIPAFATTLLGVFTGEWLRSAQSAKRKVAGMIIAGVLFVIAGKIWGVWFPINKKLWTSSYVLFTAGLGMIGLALCYWLVDMKRWRRGWTMPILVFGMNAIAAYMFSELLASCLYLIRAPGSTLVLQPYIFQHVFAPIASPSNASLLYSLGFVFVCWLVMLVLYKKKIFLKV